MHTLLLTLLVLSFPAYAAEDLFPGCNQPQWSHATKVGCFAKTRDAAVRELERTFEMAQMAARQSDEAMKNVGSKALTGLEKSLNESQASFESYKKSECERRMAYAMGGTMGADFQLSCEVELVRARIAVLDELK